MIGVLYIKGLNPGPSIFMENAVAIYAIFMVFILANLLMLPLGIAAIKSAKQLLRAPREVLMPVILLFCIVGSFAINNSIFGVVLMLAFGVVAYLMEENGFPGGARDPRHGARRDAGRALHQLDDPWRRELYCIFRAPDRRGSRRDDAAR